MTRPDPLIRRGPVVGTRRVGLTVSLLVLLPFAACGSESVDDASSTARPVANATPPRPSAPAAGAPSRPDPAATANDVVSKQDPRADATALAASVLDEKKQQYIWDLEAKTFQVEFKFGKPFAKTVLSGQADKIAKYLRDGFSAELLTGTPTVDDKGFLRRERLLRPAATEGGDAASGKTVDAAGFAAHFASIGAQFATKKKSKLRVLAIDADGYDSNASGWSLRFLLTLTGKDADGAELQHESEHEVRAHFTTNEEIEAGTILDGWRVKSEELRRAPKPLFFEATAGFGLDRVPLHDNWKAQQTAQYHFQLAVDDFNRDGYPDIAVASLDGRRMLLASDRGRGFVDVSGRAGIPPQPPRMMKVNGRTVRAFAQSYLAASIDIDDDGWPDLLLGETLFRNQGGRGFVDVTANSGIRIGHRPNGCAVADYDGDGLLDLYISYQHPADQSHVERPSWVGDAESGLGNELWLNRGEGRFENVTATANAAAGRRQTFASVPFHLDNDPYPDLYIANDFGTNVVLRNKGDGTFEDATERTGLGDFATSMGAATGDWDNDGSTDVYIANMFSKMGRRIIAHVSDDDYPEGIYPQIKGSCAGNRLYTKHGGKGGYDDLSDEFGINGVGWAYAPHFADFDGDGWLDLYATTGFMSFERDKPDG